MVIESATKEPYFTPDFDPVSLWTKSPAVQEALSSPKLTVNSYWTLVGGISPSDKLTSYYRLVKKWPYKWERRGMIWSSYAVQLGSAVSCLHLMNHFSRVAGLGSTPAMVGKIWGLLTFSWFPTLIFHGSFVAKDMMDNPLLCPPCMFTRQALVMVVGGFVFPVMAGTSYCMWSANRYSPTPLFESNKQYFSTLRSIFTPVVLKQAPRLLPFLIGTSIVAVYAQLWARERIIGTINDQPELFNKLIVRAEVESVEPDLDWGEWIERKYRKLFRKDT